MTAPAPLTPAVELRCRRCRMTASVDFIRALMDESTHGCARCFCDGIEWDIT